MSKRILLALSHSIEEHDQLRLLHDLGYEVASIGGYIDPAHPHDPKRPPLPDIPMVPVVKQTVDALGTEDNLGSAQKRIPGPILEWLGDDGIIIFHHFLERLFGQWAELAPWRRRGGRIIWRSVGQSNHILENTAAYYRRDGLERVAYSPKEAALPFYSGHDAVIRFYKDPDEWTGWRGDEPFVLNITQGLFQRGSACNPEWFVRAVEGTRSMAAGEGSEEVGGPGIVPIETMHQLLRSARAYIYTGTQPASYTLGFIEAAMTGTPVVSIGPKAWGTFFPYSPALFEAHEMSWAWSDDPAEARKVLNELLGDHDKARVASEFQRGRALELFSKDVVGAAWKAYLG